MGVLLRMSVHTEEPILVERQQARRRNEHGRELMDAGDFDGALRAFEEAVELDPELDWAWFNLGLIHKLRRNWQEAARCNRTAAELVPSDDQDAAWWNLGIASTALRDWVTAREAWRRYGIEIPQGDGPIDSDFGPTPVRIDPEGSREVVWCRRIDPARAVVLNVPFPESGHRWADIVLHDGVPNGERVIEGRTVSVFDELERWEASPTPTLKAEVVCETQADSDALSVAFEGSHLMAEDWKQRVRLLCEACSTGRPHGLHEAHEPSDLWSKERVFGIAAEWATADPLLAAWEAADPSSRSVESLEVAL